MTGKFFGKFKLEYKISIIKMDKSTETDIKRLLKHLKDNNRLKPEDQKLTVDELLEEMFGEGSIYAKNMKSNNSKGLKWKTE